MNTTTSEKSSSRAQENNDGSFENTETSAHSSRSSNSEPHETNKMTSSKSSFENKPPESVAKDNNANINNIMNQSRSLETKPALMELSTKSSDAEERNSHSSSRTQEAASEKTSSENEKSDAKENHNTYLIPKHPQCSEATKKNAINNNVKNQLPTIPGTKLSDAKVSNSKNSTGQGSNNSRSDSIDSNSTATVKRHTGGDCRWEAVQLANARDAPLGLSHFRLLKRLGYGDIGSVYLVELRGTGAYFAMKVMDRASLVSRNKLLRAQTEREILGLLDHPFLPTLYCYFETEKFYCLVMEYCSGGNLHSLRQKQPSKYFSEQAAR